MTDKTEIQKVLDKFAREYGEKKWKIIRDGDEFMLEGGQIELWLTLAFEAGREFERKQTEKKIESRVEDKDSITITDKDGTEWIYLKKKSEVKK